VRQKINKLWLFCNNIIGNSEDIYYHRDMYAEVIGCLSFGFIVCLSSFLHKTVELIRLSFSRMSLSLDSKIYYIVKSVAYLTMAHTLSSPPPHPKSMWCQLLDWFKVSITVVQLWKLLENYWHICAFVPFCLCWSWTICQLLTFTFCKESLLKISSHQLQRKSNLVFVYFVLHFATHIHFNR